MIRYYKFLIWTNIFFTNVTPQVSLNVNTIPEKVSIKLDGDFIGKTPIKSSNISPGQHTFEIEKQGFAPIKYDMTVNPSKSVSLDFFMNPIYSVVFKTAHKGLIFELNDEHKWSEDKIGLDLEAGDHQLRVYQIDQIVDEQTILVDQPLTFEYFLKKKLKAKKK